jgi:flagellin
MRINNNIMALNAHRQLGINQANSSKSMEKLSSGFRINRAGDDAAGLAISEKMRGQIRGLKQAQRNAQDGISLIQTAEGALNETHAILQRMRELATQAATDTNTVADREEIQKEIDQLAEEITRIANNTEFNTQRLLNGGITSTKFHIGANTGQDITIGIQAMDAQSLGVARDVDVDEVSGEVAGSIASADFDTTVGSEVVYGAVIRFNFETVTAEKATATVQDVIVTVNAAGEAGNSYEIKIIDPGVDNTTTTATLNGNVIVVTLARSEGAITGDTSSIVSAINALAEFTATGGSDTLGVATVDNVAFSGGIDAWEGITVDIEGGASKSFAVADNTATTFSTGSDSDFGGITITLEDSKTLANLVAASDTVTISRTTVESKAAEFVDGELVNEAIAAGGIDVSSQEAASAAIETIDTAIGKVSAERSMLGAVQNRLEHTIANLGTSAENLQAAESRIRDLDMAEEIMAFTKNNILQQAATAMLAQANMAPQSVLQLLG